VRYGRELSFLPLVLLLVVAPLGFDRRLILLHVSPLFPLGVQRVLLSG